MGKLDLFLDFEHGVWAPVGNEINWLQTTNQESGANWGKGLDPRERYSGVGLQMNVAEYSQALQGLSLYYPFFLFACLI